MRLHALPAHQPAHQMPVDGAQAADADAAPKLMEHPGGGQGAPQPGETSPRGLRWELRDQQVERMGGGQHRKQVGAPQLDGTQGMPASARAALGVKAGDEVIGDIGTQRVEQTGGAHRWQSHARRLTQSTGQSTPTEIGVAHFP